MSLGSAAPEEARISPPFRNELLETLAQRRASKESVRTIEVGGVIPGLRAATGVATQSRGSESRFASGA